MSQVSLDFRDFSNIGKCASSNEHLEIDESSDLLTSSLLRENVSAAWCFDADNVSLKDKQQKRSSNWEDNANSTDIINLTNSKTYGRERGLKSDSSKGNKDFDSFISNWCTEELPSNSKMKIIDEPKNGFSEKLNSNVDVDFDWSDIAGLCVNTQKHGATQGKSSENTQFGLGNSSELILPDILSTAHLDSSKSSDYQHGETVLLPSNCLNNLSVNSCKVLPSGASTDSNKSAQANLSDWLSSLDIVDSKRNPVNENFAKSLADLDDDDTCGSFDDYNYSNSFLSDSKIREYKRNLSNSGSNPSDPDSGFTSGSPESATGTISTDDNDTENGIFCPKASNNNKFSFFDSSPDSACDLKSFLDTIPESCLNTPLNIQKPETCDINLLSYLNGTENKDDVDSTPAIDLSACIKKPSYSPENVPSTLLPESDDGDKTCEKDVPIVVLEVENTPSTVVLPKLLVSSYSATKRPNVKSSLFAKALSCKSETPNDILKKINRIKADLSGSLFLRPECVEILNEREDVVVPTSLPVITCSGRKFFGVPRSYEIS